LGGRPHAPSGPQLAEEGETFGYGFPVSISVGPHWDNFSLSTSSPTRPVHHILMVLDGYNNDEGGNTHVKKENEAAK